MKAKQAFWLAASAMIVSLALNDGAFAQGRGSGQGPGQNQSQGRGRGQGVGGGQQQNQRQSQNQQRKQKEIRERIRDRDIYGRDLMTATERDQYRERVNAAASDAEWARIRAEHMNEMQARARSQNRSLDPPVYGENMLTARERRQYQQRLEAATNQAERDRIRTEHRAMIRDRAMLLGLPTPPE